MEGEWVTGCYHFCYENIAFAPALCYTRNMKRINSPRMVIMPRDEAISLITDFIPTFRECLDQAWHFVEQVFSENADRRTAFSATTRANMIYDRLVQLIRRVLDGNPRIAMTTRGRMLRLVVDSRILIRFKKLDDSLRARNVRTDSQRRDYFQLWLPGMEEPQLTKITFGYRLNETATEILGRYVTCPKNWEENHWTAALDDPASDAMPLFTPIDQPDSGKLTGIVITAKHNGPKKGSASA